VFGALLQPEHHLAFHREVERVTDHVVDDGAECPQEAEPRRHRQPYPAGIPLADQQPGPVLRKWLEDERPRPHHQGMVRFEHGDGRVDPEVADRAGCDAVADLQLLELGVDPGGGASAFYVVDGAGEPLEPVVAINPARWSPMFTRLLATELG